MREIGDCGDLAARCDGDLLCLWAARGLDGRSRAWASADGRAVAVAGPALSARDRLVVRGPLEAAAPLARRVLAEVGPAYRPLGDRRLVDALVREVPELDRAGSFGWMDRTGPGVPVPDSGAAGWLPEAALPEAAALVEAAFPDSYAKPGVPGVDRWAGVRDDGGGLVAVGALAWSGPTVALLAGITVAPRARGRGHGRRVCALLLTEALRVHGAAALMVDDWNAPALRLYRGLGLRYRPLAAAAVRP